jgi:Ca2+/Na+ antiporter
VVFSLSKTYQKSIISGLTEEKNTMLCAYVLNKVQNFDFSLLFLHDNPPWFPTGFTLGIPDTVMGLTFIAAGVSVPDALSGIAVCKEGHGRP